MAEHGKTIAAILSGGPPEKDEGYDAQAHLEQAMEDLHRALKAESPSYKGMAAAFRSAFECLESEPHDEGDGEGDEEESN